VLVSNADPTSKFVRTSLRAILTGIDDSDLLPASGQSTSRRKVYEVAADVVEANRIKQHSNSPRSPRRPIIADPPSRSTEDIPGGQHRDPNRKSKVTLIVSPDNKPTDPVHHTNEVAASPNPGGGVTRENEQRRREWDTWAS
jgi:hypothetical protein